MKWPDDSKLPADLKEQREKLQVMLSVLSHS